MLDPDLNMWKTAEPVVTSTSRPSDPVSALTVEPGAHVEGALKRYSKPEAIEPEPKADPKADNDGKPDLKTVEGGASRTAVAAPVVKTAS